MQADFYFKSSFNSYVQGGSWSDVDSECVPCDMCELPNAGMNMEVKYITGTMDAEVTCYDGVIEPGNIF